MNYTKYLIEFAIVATIMCLSLHYFINQTWKDALIIGTTTALLTVVNRYFLDKKALRKQNKTKSKSL